LSLKERENLINFTLLLHEINPYEMRIVTNKGNIVFITMRRYNRRRGGGSRRRKR
jgi:hypothetical protein